MAVIKNVFYDGKTFLLIFLGFCQIFSVTMSKATENNYNVIVKKVSPTLTHGEGPHWDVISQKLYFVDIAAQKILRLDPVSGKVTSAYLKGGPVGVVVPIEGAKDKFIAGCGRDVVVVTWDGANDVTDPPTKKLTSLDTDRNDTRINDGKCDPAGRFWVGTMGLQPDTEPNRGALYVVENDATSKQVLSPVSISNGLIWNAQNNKMYYIDSPTRQVWGFDYDKTTGSITNKKVIFDLEKNDIKNGAVPDGMTIDADDNLWVALYDGGAIIQVDPKSGKLLRSVELPVPQVTSAAFGGAELDILFVTTLSGLYSITNLGVKGTPSTNFKSTLKF